MINCWEIFDVGCLLLIHGKITMRLVDRGTARQEHGLWTATRSRNGKILVLVLFYISLGSVSFQPMLNLSDCLTVISFLSGRRQECTLVRLRCNITVLRTYSFWLVLQSSRKSRQCVNLGSRHWRCFSMTSEKIRRRIYVAYCRPCYSSFATSPIHTTIFYPLSTRHTDKVHKALEMTNLSNVLKAC
jgi:hypothetical protein